jgi:hypothetical protein
MELGRFGLGPKFSPADNGDMKPISASQPRAIQTTQSNQASGPAKTSAPGGEAASGVKAKAKGGGGVKSSGADDAAADELLLEQQQQQDLQAKTRQADTLRNELIGKDSFG